MSSQLPELLAPAGDEASFLAALSAGADAIYLGGLKFNARAHATNFDNDTLQRCIKLAHSYGKKVYVTLNTLLYDREIEEAVAYATDLMNMHVDAIICCDVGLMSVLQSREQNFSLDASTQLSLHSSSGVKEVEDLHFRQVVVARELSKNNIQLILEKTEAPLEIFAHGALCVCHSGQCLFSSLIGGRSGNRGECAQPCRLPYKNGYALSLKDLTLSKHITELIAMGVKSLKIEGRMKAPEYVYRVVRIFRKLLDEKRNATDIEYKELEEIFSRSGFTDGYFENKNQNMLGVRSDEDKNRTKLASNFTFEELPKIKLKAVITIARGEPVTLEVSDELGREAKVVGCLPNEAISSPLTKESVKERLKKLGGTPYRMDDEDIEVILDSSLNLSPSQLNGLRREAIDALCKEKTNSFDKPTFVYKKSNFTGFKRTALFYSANTWNQIKGDMIDFAFVPLSEYPYAKKENTGIWLPPIITDSEENQVEQLLIKAKEHGAKIALCSNPGSVYLAKQHSLSVVGDFRLNITNAFSANYWNSHGVRDAILSPELTAPQARDIGGMVIVYGRIPLMLTERCYSKPIGGCEKCGNISLVDRKNMAFPIIRIPDHRNYILNSVPTYMGDQKDKIPKSCREFFMFFTETKEEIETVLSSYEKGKPLAFPVRRFPK